MEETSAACEDMIFFERRLTEVILSMKPIAFKWRVVLVCSILSVLYSTYHLMLDPNVRFVTVWESLCKHPFFAASFITFFGLFLFFGIHRRISAPKIIAARCRNVLADFCLSCDESGKLIVRPANVANFSFGMSTTSTTNDRSVSFA